MVCSQLREHSGTARLDGLDLGEGERGAVEAGGELAAVEVDALGRGDRPEVGASLAANASVGGRDGLAQRPKLLRVVAVRAEGGVRRLEVGRERLGRRRRMGLRRVIDRDCREKS